MSQCFIHNRDRIIPGRDSCAILTLTSLLCMQAGSGVARSDVAPTLGLHTKAFLEFYWLRTGL